MVPHDGDSGRKRGRDGEHNVQIQANDYRAWELGFPRFSPILSYGHPLGPAIHGALTCQRIPLSRSTLVALLACTSPHRPRSGLSAGEYLDFCRSCLFYDFYGSQY